MEKRTSILRQTDPRHECRTRCPRSVSRPLAPAYAPVPPSPAGSGRRRGGVGPALAQPGLSTSPVRRRWPAAGGSPACRYSRGGGRPPWPVRRSRRWWSPGQWSGARRRVPPRPAKPGPATRSSPGRVDGRGPTGSRRKVPRVDGALDRAAQGAGSTRCATHRVVNDRPQPAQTPPASSSCRSCSPAPGHRPGRGAAGRVRAGRGAAPGWPEGAARHWPPSGGRRR